MGASAAATAAGAAWLVRAVEVATQGGALIVEDDPELQVREPAYPFAPVVRCG
jgi:hypothetical protein